MERISTKICRHLFVVDQIQAYILLHEVDVSNITKSMNIISKTFIFIIIDPNVWHQEHDECNKICTIQSQNLSCFDTHTAVRAVFQFDINLPVNMYSFGVCKSCFNITQINITCMSDTRSMKSEPQSTQRVEITTSKIISESYSTQNEGVTSKMISKCSGKFFSLSLSCLSSSLRKICIKNYNHFPNSVILRFTEQANVS